MAAEYGSYSMTVTVLGSTPSAFTLTTVIIGKPDGK